MWFDPAAANCRVYKSGLLWRTSLSAVSVCLKVVDLIASGCGMPSNAAASFGGHESLGLI